MRMLDLFSGIGGFHKGFEQAGWSFDWVGFSEIDKYASAVYKHRFPNAKELGDITAIRPERDLPDHIDILCGGFPCQAFSTAGKRKGFDDTRGTLFFEIARILRHYRDTGKPIDCFVLENVKGLLSHDNGRTFAVIYRVLTDLDYTVECQLLNTRWVLAQNRERIYIVGHIGRGSRAKVFPVGEDGAGHNEERISRKTATGQGQGMQHTQDRRGCALPGDGQVKAVIGTERIMKNQNGRRIKEHNEPMFTLSAQDQHGVMQDYTIINKQGQSKNNQEYAATLQGGGNSGGNHSDMDLLQYKQTNIRRLTPIECERLQGFPDQWTSKGNLDGKVVNISDTQRYKQCGNAVSVPIVQLVAEKIHDNI